jgi:hypothetical protein
LECEWRGLREHEREKPAQLREAGTDREELSPKVVEVLKKFRRKLRG